MTQLQNSEIRKPYIKLHILSHCIWSITAINEKQQKYVMNKHFKGNKFQYFNNRIHFIFYCTLNILNSYHITQSYNSLLFYYK